MSDLPPHHTSPDSAPVIDPTENVIALVKAGERATDAIRTADNRFLDAQINNLKTIQEFALSEKAKFQDFARDAEARYTRDVMAAETRRIDQLASTRQEFQNTIRDMLAESVRTTSALVSTQLVQIQATFDARVTKLEQAQLTQAGRSSVADPATEAAMSRITGTLNTINAELSSIRAGESLVGGRSRGVMDANSRVMTMIMVLATVATPIIAGLAIFAMRGPH